MEKKTDEEDKWLKSTMGRVWVMKKNLIEILTHIELKNIEFVLYKLENFERINKPYLQQDKKAALFVKFLKISVLNPEKVNTEEFIQEFYSQVEEKPREEEDIFILSFFAWLKSKMYNQGIYETTLSLVQTDNN